MSYIVGDLIKKAKIEKCKKQDFPVLSMTMKDGIVFQNDRFKKQIASIDKSSYNIVKRNQLVVSFPIDEGVLAVQDIIDFGIVSPAYKIWDINDYLVIPKFLEAFLRSPHSIQYYKSKLHGSTARRRTITDSDLLQMEVPLVSFTEQKRILENIRKVKHIITYRRIQLEKLDLLVKARFVEMFGDSSKYNIEQLKNNVEEMFIGPFGSALKSEYFVDEKDAYCMVYEQKHAIQKTLNLPTRYVDKEKYNELKRFTVLGNDIIISCRGTIGEIYSIPKDAPMGIMHPSIMKIRLNKEKYRNLFFTIMLEQYMQNSMTKAKGSGVKMAVTATELGKEFFIVPSIEEQKTFENFVKQVDKSKATVQKALDEAQLLFDSLMQEYFG